MITIKGFSKKYRKQCIYKNVELFFPDNGIFFLLGRNGSGKTTLIKCLLELEEYEGEILFDNNPYEKISDTIVCVYDDAMLYDNLTGFQNIQILLKDNIICRKEIVDFGLLSMEKLKQKSKYYSLGEKKKLYIIMIMLRKPRYLIIDEISNGLDYETLQDLKRFIVKISKDVLILATGHNFSFYEDIVQNVYFIKTGNIYEIENYMKGGTTLSEIYEENIP